MQKLFVAPAVAGLAISLFGTAQDRAASAAESGRRLSPGEMKKTQGRGYSCTLPVCDPDGQQLCEDNRPSTGDSTQWLFYYGLQCGPAAQGTCLNDKSGPCEGWIIFDSLGCNGEVVSQQDPDTRVKCQT
jgi:hypothetical protein